MARYSHGGAPGFAWGPRQEASAAFAGLVPGPNGLIPRPSAAASSSNGSHRQQRQRASSTGSQRVGRDHALVVPATT